MYPAKQRGKENSPKPALVPGTIQLSCCILPLS